MLELHENLELTDAITTEDIIKMYKTDAEKSDASKDLDKVKKTSKILWQNNIEPRNKIVCWCLLLNQLLKNKHQPKVCDPLPWQREEELNKAFLLFDEHFNIFAEKVSK